MSYTAILQKSICERTRCHDNRPSECEDVDGLPNPTPINARVVSGPISSSALPISSLPSFVGVRSHPGTQANEVVMTFLSSDRPRCRPQLRRCLGQHRVRVHFALWLLAVTTVVISDSSFVLHLPHEVCYLQRDYSVQAVVPFIRLPVFDKVC